MKITTGELLRKNFGRLTTVKPWLYCKIWIFHTHIHTTTVVVKNNLIHSDMLMLLNSFKHRHQQLEEDNSSSSSLKGSISFII
jgi:hypothetical protein